MSKLGSIAFLVYAAVIFIFLMLLAFPFVIIFSALLDDIPGKRATLEVIKIWAKSFRLLCFYTIEVKEVELVNTGRPNIYISNHGSYLDAIVVCHTIPQPFSALGKIEMVKIPIFGWIYKRIVILIDRSKKESRTESVQQLRYYIEKGQSILIFPEGTMNKSPQALKEFYDGAFRLAIDTNTSIQPFIIINNRKLLSRTAPLTAKPGKLTSIFLEPISVEGYSHETLPQLKEKVHQLMFNALEKYPS